MVMVRCHDPRQTERCAYNSLTEDSLLPLIPLCTNGYHFTLCLVLYYIVIFIHLVINSIMFIHTYIRMYMHIW